MFPAGALDSLSFLIIFFTEVRLGAADRNAITPVSVGGKVVIASVYINRVVSDLLRGTMLVNFLNLLFRWRRAVKSIHDSGADHLDVYGRRVRLGCTNLLVFLGLCS